MEHPTRKGSDFMADSARRRHGEIQRSIFEALLSEPNGLPVTEVLSRAEMLLPPTQFENQDYPDQPGVSVGTRRSSGSPRSAR